ncbi:hypothetical protein As57867_003636, partial [Aphanomyces stellatus]
PFDNIELLSLLREFQPKAWSRWALSCTLSRSAHASALYVYTNCPETHYDGMLDDAAEHGLLELVQRMHGDGATCTTKAMSGAAGNGHLEIVKFLHTHRTEGWASETVTLAAWGGHVAVLAYLLHHRPHEVNLPMALKGAAANGHIDALQFLRSMAVAASVDYRLTLDDAARNGHLSMVKYLHGLEAAVLCSDQAVTSAATCGHEGVVRFLMQHRTESASPEAVQKALMWGHCSIARYLVEEHGLSIQPLDLDWLLFDKATALDVVAFLCDHDTPWQTSWMDAACNFKSNLPLVQALHAHSTVGCTTAAMDNAAKQGDLDVVLFLATHRTEGCTVQAFNHAVRLRTPDVLLCLWHHYPEVFRDSVYFTWIEDDMLHVMLDHKMGKPLHILPKLYPNQRQITTVLGYGLDQATPVANLLSLAQLHKKLTTPHFLLTPSHIATEKAIMDQVHAWGKSHVSKDPNEWTELDVAASSVLATKDLSSWVNIVVFQHYFVQDAAGHESDLCDVVGNIEPIDIKRDCVAMMQGLRLGLLLAWPKEG